MGAGAGKSKAPSSQGVSKFEYGAVMAASLAYLLSNQQDLVGLSVFDTDIRLEIPQGNGASHLDEIFKQLEKISTGKRRMWRIRCIIWRTRFRGAGW